MWRSSKVVTVPIDVVAVVHRRLHKITWGKVDVEDVAVVGAPDTPLVIHNSVDASRARVVRVRFIVVARSGVQCRGRWR